MLVELLLIEVFIIEKADNYTNTIKESLDQLQKGLVFDHLITDIIIEDGLGFDIAENFKLANPNINIIYITGYGTKKFNEHIKQTPGTLLQKPFSIKSLISAISDKQINQ